MKLDSVIMGSGIMALMSIGCPCVHCSDIVIRDKKVDPDALPSLALFSFWTY